MSKKTRRTYCPSCDHPIHFTTTVRIGQMLACHSCHSELEVVALNPLQLDWALDYEDSADNAYIDYSYEDFVVSRT